MFRPGLVSATFRHLNPAEILALAQTAGVEGMMWNGDVHVPVGQPSLAREVARMTADAGLEIEGFGSYYRAGAEQEFERELETTVALGAPRIRVWAGAKGSAIVTDAERAAIIQDLHRCVQLAGRAGVTVGIEFHDRTLTDTAESAADMMTALQGSGVRLYWQPPNGMPKTDALAGLRLVLPWVDHVHVFQWLMRDGEQIRLPLADGAAVWPAYFEALSESPQDRWAMLEFVKGDSPEQFLADARQLRDWLAER